MRAARRIKDKVAQAAKLNTPIRQVQLLARSTFAQIYYILLGLLVAVRFKDALVQNSPLDRCACPRRITMPIRKVLRSKAPHSKAVILRDVLKFSWCD